MTAKCEARVLLECDGAGRHAISGVAGYCLLMGVSGPVLAPLPRMLLSPKVSIKAPLSICQPWVGLSIKVDPASRRVERPDA